MKKVLVSLLVGVTLCGGLFGCGNKEVEETKIETKNEVESTYEDEEDNIIEEEQGLSNEEKMNLTKTQIEFYFNDFANTVNSKSDDYFITFEVTVMENTINIKYSMVYTSYDNSSMVMAIMDDPTCEESGVNILHEFYETANNIAIINDVQDYTIVIDSYVGEYKVMTTTDNEITYDITGYYLPKTDL